MSRLHNDFWLTNPITALLGCFFRQRSPETNEHSFNQIQSSLIHLLAEIEVWIYEKNIPVRGNGQYSTQSAKRMRRNRQGNVLDDTLANVSLLGPVTCMFIRNHGALLAEEDFEIFCSHIGKQIQDSLQHSFVAEQVKPGMFHMRPTISQD